MDQFKSYRNVYRQALMWGLPMTMFFAFAGASLLNLIVLGTLAWINLWYISVVLLAANFIAYFLIRGLVAKYGSFFLDKLMAHYFLHTFTTVRVNRLARNLISPKH